MNTYSNSSSLLEQLISANKEEFAATLELKAALEGKNADEHLLNELSQRMIDAHNKKMDVLDQLRQPGSGN